jgi:leader peptidase (prepilin peptidase)/N-methyltransferase
MGGGDMKLGAMMGAFLGYKLALLALFLAAILGGVVALGLLSTGIRRRKDPIPFGPFLAIAAAVAMLWGETILTWYLRVFSL